MGRLDGRVALVTGGSGGIGRAAVLELAREGADIAVQYHRGKAAAQGVVEEVRGLGRKAIAVPTDVSDARACRELAAEAVASLGRLDVVACFAGHPFRDDEWYRDFEQLTRADLERPLDVDLLGSVFVAQATLPSMVKNGRGSLILIGSTPAITGDRVGISNLIAKAGILGLTRALALVYGPKGVRVNALALGSIASGPMEALAEPEKRVLAEEPALKRWGTVEEVARVVAFLASDDSSYITGQTIVVDGGYALR
ncbi:MAG: SDR family NAD(P)-dependent oxidoreductase [Thermoplasmata archaeon]